MDVEKALPADAVSIDRLIHSYSGEGALLPRRLEDIYRCIRDFFVCRENGQVVGCVSLQIVWDNLAEIRSLAVRPDRQNQGIGTGLVEACVQEARNLRVGSVFVLTKTPPFFARLGFHHLDKSELPQKIWSDCVLCPKFPGCDEEAMGISIEL